MPDLNWVHAFLICIFDMHFWYAFLICIFDMHFWYAFLICIFDMHFWYLLHQNLHNHLCKDSILIGMSVVNFEIHQKMSPIHQKCFGYNVVYHKQCCQKWRRINCKYNKNLSRVYAASAQIKYEFLWHVIFVSTSFIVYPHVKYHKNFNQSCNIVTKVSWMKSGVNFLDYLTGNQQILRIITTSGH